MGYLKGLRDPKGLEGSGDVGCLPGHKSVGDLEGPVVWEVNKVKKNARTSLQLPLQQWSAGYVYLLVIFR